MISELRSTRKYLAVVYTSTWTCHVLNFYNVAIYSLDSCWFIMDDKLTRRGKRHCIYDWHEIKSVKIIFLRFYT